jgi:hypothetical protein
VIYLLAASLPFFVVLGIVAVRIWLDLRRPTPQALGSILRRLCVVDYAEITRYNELAQTEEKAARHLQREVRWKQIAVNWGFLRLMIWNTKAFHQATRFEKIKIDPTKSGLAYESREHLVLELVDDSVELRRRLHKCRLRLLMRAILGRRPDYKIFTDLLVQYKQLEEDIVAFASMADDGSYREMLIERLGLRRSWGLLDGGADSPA